MAVKARWECRELQRQFLPTQDTEFRQRLAEILEILLSKGSQLPKESAFSRDPLEMSKPRSQKRKDTT